MDEREIKPFTYCLNTSTIRGQALTLQEEIEVTAQAGYDSIELWIREIDAFTSTGSQLSDLRKMLSDAGLSVPNVIGFFAWAAHDANLRQKGLEEAHRNMEICAAIGSPYIAAPPFSVTDESIPIVILADRYRQLLDIGKEIGVKPMLEFWGISQTLQRINECTAVIKQVGDKDACVLVDVFHMAKGGSSFEDLLSLEANTLGLLHLNDYSNQPLDKQTDADRLYPGDGDAPLIYILASLKSIGYSGPLSIELFNPGYWQNDALSVAETALEKTKKLVEKLRTHTPLHSGD